MAQILVTYLPVSLHHKTYGIKYYNECVTYVIHINKVQKFKLHYYSQDHIYINKGTTHGINFLFNPHMILRIARVDLALIFGLGYG